MDALTEAHLLALGEAARAQALLIGGAGRAAAVARQLPRAGAGSAPPGGPGAVLAASAARETLSQTGLARLFAPTFDLRGEGDASAALDWAAPLLSEEAPVVLAVMPAALPAIGAVAQGLVAHGVRRLLVAGEEACEAVVAALGASVLRIGVEAEPGLPWCAVQGGALHLLLKPGVAGARDIMLRAFAATA